MERPLPAVGRRRAPHGRRGGSRRNVLSESRKLVFTATILPVMMMRTPRCHSARHRAGASRGRPPPSAGTPPAVVSLGAPRWPRSGRFRRRRQARPGHEYPAGTGLPEGSDGDSSVFTGWKGLCSSFGCTGSMSGQHHRMVACRVSAAVSDRQHRGFNRDRLRRPALCGAPAHHHTSSKRSVRANAPRHANAPGVAPCRLTNGVRRVRTCAGRG